MARQSREVAIPAFLISRPAAQGQVLASDLRKNFGPDIRIVQSPLMATSYLSPAVEKRDWSGMLFTSANGVEGARQLSLGEGLPAFCVGEATAEAARQAGYDAQSADGDAEDLTKLVLKLGVRGPLLHARGQHVSGNLAQALNSAGIETIEVIVYSQDAIALTHDAKALLAQTIPVIVPLYSPRTARLLSQEINGQILQASLYVVAISEAVVRAIDFPAKVVVADRPNASAMMVAMAGLVATVGQP